MKIHDISMAIRPGMQVYKNKEEKKPAITMTRTLEEGAQESKLTMDLHTGTHLDAPSHMLKGGDPITKFPLEKGISRATVIDLTSVQGGITEKDLASHKIMPDEFILLKTRNSFTEKFDLEFVYLEKSGAQFLARKKVSGVGIDGLGIERSQPGHETHTTLLKKGIVVLEGLRLKQISAGTYTLVCLPLAIEQGDASPVRAVLIEGDLVG